jgi:hypothetical protein
MNRCPNCASTGGLTLSPVLVARPAGSYSLAGAQDKTAATQAARLSCAGCGWWATGRVEGLQMADDGTITGGHLVIDQSDTASADPPATVQAATSQRDEQRLRAYWSAGLGRHVTIPDHEDGPG